MPDAGLAVSQLQDEAQPAIVGIGEVAGQLWDGRVLEEMREEPMVRLLLEGLMDIAQRRCQLW